jgi:LacI family transcriptional regulator
MIHLFKNVLKNKYKMIDSRPHIKYKRSMSDANAKHTAADRLASILRNNIQNGVWAVGSRVPTIRQIAQDHGVSVNTAMYAYRHLEREALVERRPHGSGVVVAKPNDAPAMSTSTAPIGQIAVLGPTGPRQDYALRDEWWIRILMAAEEALMEGGECTLVRVGSVNSDHERAMGQIIEQVRSLRSQLSGILIPNANTIAHVRLIEVCEKLDLPWITINRPYHQVMTNFVCGNNVLTGMLAGRCFLELGIDRVLHLCGRMDYLSKRENISGLAQPYWLAGRQVDGLRTLRCHGHLEEQGYEAVDTFLRHNDPPQAIFSDSDILVVGAMRACKTHGLSIPGDINLLGGTGLDVAECVSPALATVTQPMRKIGREAARMLLHLIHTGRRRVTGKLLNPTLTVRASLALDPDQARQIEQSLRTEQMDRIINDESQDIND